MKKLFALFCLFPVLVLAQEISIYGNRGMFKLQYAQPHNMGMLSFHIAPEERYEELPITINSESVTDRKHFFKVSTGISYSIVDYLEARVRLTPFMKWFEMSNYPIQRGDPDPVIGFETIELGTKAGYPVIIDETSPLMYALGVDGYIDFGPSLSTEWFSNALMCDKGFYSDSFTEGGAPYQTPHFPPYIPHDPDYGFSGLFDFRIGPFATHINLGYMVTGPDKRPDYVDSTEFVEKYQRPNYFTHGGGVELIPSEDVRILFETIGRFDIDASKESLWITPGLRFGARNVSFDLGCELGIHDSPFWWKAFINFSAGADLIKKVEVHIPIAKISGKIYDAETEEPIAATISFPGSEKAAIQTALAGSYQVSFSPGSYRIRVDAPGYRWKEQGIVLKDGDQIVLDFKLNKKMVSKILGKIYDTETKLPIVAEISFPQTNFSNITSDTAGMYKATLAPGTFRIHVEATNYQFDEKVLTLKVGDTKVVDFGLVKIGVAQATLMGKVSEKETGKPILAQITFIDTKIPAITTDPATGIYKLTVSPGTYSVKVEAQDYITESAPIVLAKDETKIQNFTMRKVPKVGERIILKGIYFDFNSAVIKPTSYPVLDDAAKVLIAKPKMRVEIGGHTDSIGSDSYNMKLSYQRANAVKDYLMRYHNIDLSRLEVRGYGESQPIADNRTRSGRDLNRRIEFKILSTE